MAIVVRQESAELAAIERMIEATTKGISEIEEEIEASAEALDRIETSVKKAEDGVDRFLGNFETFCEPERSGRGATKWIDVDRFRIENFDLFWEYLDQNSILQARKVCAAWNTMGHNPVLIAKGFNCLGIAPALDKNHIALVQITPRLEHIKSTGEATARSIDDLKFIGTGVVVFAVQILPQILIKA